MTSIEALRIAIATTRNPYLSGRSGHYNPDKENDQGHSMEITDSSPNYDNPPRPSTTVTYHNYMEALRAIEQHRYTQHY